jgi:RNA recognition motif-containing protein
VTKLFVGNLSFEVTPVDLRAAFAAYGQVSSADIVTDRSSGQSRGFGFIEMAGQAAEAAMQGLDGSVLKGRTINVSRAHARSEGGNRGNAAPGWAVVGDGRHRW